jgi:two-component system LytT family response regulator
MKIKCIAIDDEPLALQQMGKYIQMTPFLDCVSLCNSPFEALDILENNDIDLMFVDINMPDLNGLDFIKSLDKKPLVVIVTAYGEYALEGYKADAIDYLLKPLDYAGFLKSANKVKSLYERFNSEDKEKQTDEGYLYVKSENRIARVKIKDISFVESANEYIKINMSGKEVIQSLTRLKDFELLLPVNSFLRVHRSYIINLTKIKAIEKNGVLLENDVFIPIGELYRSSFQEYLKTIIKS